MRTCTECGKELATIARAHTATCSPACRKRRSRRSVPTELSSLPRWVRHTADKRPITTTGGPASSTNPSTWSSYVSASRSQSGTGLGFVLNGDGIACIDLDHCLTDSGVAVWARDILDRCSPTYVEISPSGDGLHIWGRANVPHGRRISVPGGTAEIYGTGRYITVTGRRHGNAPTVLADLSTVIAHLTA